MSQVVGGEGFGVKGWRMLGGVWGKEVFALGVVMCVGDFVSVCNGTGGSCRDALVLVI